MSSTRFCIAATVAAAALAVSGCGGGDEETGAAAGGGAEGKPTTVKMASLGVASDAAMMLGRKKGFFEQEGIDLQSPAAASTGPCSARPRGCR